MKKRILCVLTVLLLMIPSMSVMAAEKLEQANLEYTFSNIDGGEITTKSEGKPKLIVFFMTSCGNCKATLQSIASSDWIGNGEIDVCAIEVSNVATTDIETFRSTYCSGSPIKFGTSGASKGNQAFNYRDAAGMTGRTTPIIAMVDADNTLQNVTMGNIAAATIASEYLPNLTPSQQPVTPPSGNEPETPSNPENPETPSNPSAGETGKPEDVSGTQGSSKNDVVCNHVGESTLVSEATATGDAVQMYKCAKCGAVLGYEVVPNSAVATFISETADAIRNAKQTEVVIDTKIWTCFNRTVFEAMKSRPDVTVTVNYIYKGNPYVLSIPAGTNVDLLMDENGYGGFRYIDAVLNAKN